MKINRLEAHDRLSYVKQDQGLNIFQGADDCMKRNELSLFLQEHSSYIYLYAHPRTTEEGNKEMYWQPRLTRPKSSTNAYLFRGEAKSDNVEICWLIPPMEIWPQYQKGKLFEHEIVTWSIEQFKKHKKELDASLSEDLPEHRVREIYIMLKKDLETAKKPMPKILELPNALDFI